MQKLKSGFALISIIIVAVLVAALLGGGYFLTKSGKLPSSISNVVPGASLIPKVTEADLAHIEDPTLRKHFVAQFNKTAFRIKTTTEGTIKSVSTSQFQLAGQDALYRITNSDGQKDTSDLISIKDITYVKDFSDNKWWKQKAEPPKEVKDEVSKSEESTKEFTENTKKLTYKQLGKEACGSLACYKYEEIDEGRLSRTFWFDDKELLLRREEFPFEGFKTANEYSYNSINLKEPSPTKDVPEGKNIFEYYTTANPEFPTQDQQMNQQQDQVPNVSDSMPTDYSPPEVPYGDE